MFLFDETYDETNENTTVEEGKEEDNVETDDVEGTQDKDTSTDEKEEDNIVDEGEISDDELDTEISSLKERIAELEAKKKETESRSEENSLKGQIGKLEEQIMRLTEEALKRQAESEVDAVMTQYADFFEDEAKDMKNIISISAKKNVDLDTAAKLYFFESLNKKGMTEAYKLNKTMRKQKSIEDQEREALRKAVLGE